jgi:hypothetical protein
MILALQHCTIVGEAFRLEHGTSSHIVMKLSLRGRPTAPALL